MPILKNDKHELYPYILALTILICQKNKFVLTQSQDGYYTDILGDLITFGLYKKEVELEKDTSECGSCELSKKLLEEWKEALDVQKLNPPKDGEFKVPREFKKVDLLLKNSTLTDYGFNANDVSDCRQIVFILLNYDANVGIAPSQSQIPFRLMGCSKTKKDAITRQVSLNKATMKCLRHIITQESPKETASLKVLLERLKKKQL